MSCRALGLKLTKAWGPDFPKVSLFFSHLPPTDSCLQFNICANSSLHSYAKIFPRDNHTVSVDIYQGVSAAGQVTPYRGRGL